MTSQSTWLRSAAMAGMSSRRMSTAHTCGTWRPPQGRVSEPSTVCRPAVSRSSRTARRLQHRWTTRCRSPADAGTCARGRIAACCSEWQGLVPNSAAFSSDGKSVVTANQDQTVTVLNIADENQKVFRGHRAPVLSVAFSPDNRSIVSGSADTTARVWDVGAAQQIVVLEGHSGQVSWATFNHDGRVVLTVSGEVRSAGIPAAKSDRTTRVWEARTGKPLVTRAAGVAGFNPARNLVISPTERSDVVSVLEMASGRTIARLSGLTGQVTTTAFSRDGTLVAAAARDVGIWNTFRTKRPSPALRSGRGRRYCPRP